MTLSPAEHEQRKRAARKHGIDAYQAHGESALDAPERSRLVELRDAVQTKRGIVDLMQERAASAVLVVELAESWVRKELEAGKPFDEIQLLRRLGTYQETARRALGDLLKASPDEPGARDITEYLQGSND